mmetsp:Transcript_28084/g.68284  ORF Transcript_28084/g.68284 Transcript_28084/m.68284 type:complete len:570 (-) Transcript_28084:249-1958(-)
MTQPTKSDVERQAEVAAATWQGGASGTTKTGNPIIDAEDIQPEQKPDLGCGILGRYPIISVTSFAAIGIGIGVGLSYWDPEDPEAKEKALKWIGLIGDLFIRALKAVVLPLVFCNVAVSIVDMIGQGRASSVGWKTIGLYIMTTLIASIIGLISVLIFQSQFTTGTFDETNEAYVALGCTDPGSVVMEDSTDSSLTCVADGNLTSPFSQFELLDLSGSLARADGAGFADLSMSDTVYAGVFLKMITDNVFFSFVDGNFAAVIIFAIVFGIALGKIYFEQEEEKLKDGSTGQTDAEMAVKFFTAMGEILLKMINWIIAVTPFAVCSLIAQAIGSQDDLAGAFGNVGWLIAANLVGYIGHFLVTDVGLHWLLTRKNPFAYLRFIIPAQTTALACASSAATLPVTLRCVKATGQVPDDIRTFILPLGATINMDGSAIYFPIACIWLAILNGQDVNAASYILLIILSTIGSAGAAPVPSSGLVLVITAYNTVFGGTGVPLGFEFVVAIDWFLDRCITALNVTGDTVVAHIVSCNTPYDDNFELGKDDIVAKSHMEVEDPTNITKGKSDSESDE